MPEKNEHSLRQYVGVGLGALVAALVVAGPECKEEYDYRFNSKDSNSGTDIKACAIGLNQEISCNKGVSQKCKDWGLEAASNPLGVSERPMECEKIEYVIVKEWK